MKHCLCIFSLLVALLAGPSLKGQSFYFPAVYSPAGCSYTYQLTSKISLDSLLVTNIYYDDGTNGSFAFEAFVSYQNVFAASTLPTGNFYTYQITLFSDNPNLTTNTLSNNINAVPLQSAAAGGFASANNPTFNASASSLGLSQGQYYSSPSLLAQLGFDSATLHINLPCKDTVLKTTSAGEPLPLTWSPLRASVAGMDISLSWQTFSERNTHRFEVQRSLDGIGWRAIAYLPTKAEAGNSKTILAYDAVVKEAAGGRYYYRVLQYDKSGAVTVSNMVQVYVLSAAKDELQVYPNPAGSVLYLGAARPMAAYTITDAYGRVLKNGVYNGGIDVEAIAAGIYFIRYDGDYRRFVIAR